MDQDTLANVPANARAGLIAMNANNPPRPTPEQQETALEALNLMREGMLLDRIAERLERTPGAISALVIKYYPEEWKAAKTAANLIRLERAQREFDNDGTGQDSFGNHTEALDGLKLAYARERAKYSLAMLAVTKREMFDLSDKTAINVNAAGQVTIQVVSFAGQESAIDAPQQVQRSIEE